MYSFEELNISLTENEVDLENDNTMLSKKANSDFSSVFGKIRAVSGEIHHWIIKIMSDGVEWKGELGIIEADKVENIDKLNKWWYTKSYYFCYDLKGTASKGVCSTPYAMMYDFDFDFGDTLHIWLDLKNTNNVSWGKNEIRFGKCLYKLKNKTDYKLAVRLYHGKLQMVIKYQSFHHHVLISFP